MKTFSITSPFSCSFTDAPEPAPAEGEVLLRPVYVGLCGSDLKTYRGENPMAGFPRVPGHELSAVIEKTGPGVSGEWSVGTLVTVLPYSNCGVCSSCRKGRPNACESNQTLGVQRDGCLAERIAVPVDKLVRANGLSPRALALVEPLSIGCHAVRRTDVRKGETVAVIGCGAVGLGAVAAAAAAGATVIAVDVDDVKLGTARQAGAVHSVNSKTTGLRKGLRSIVKDGPDVVIEAVGSPLTFRSAVEEVSFSGRVVYIGYAKEPVSYETKLFVQKELDIRGSRNADPEDFQTAIRILSSGRFPAERVISRIEPFSRTGQALEDWHADPAAFTKILIGM
jgi:threonine dehydrogenase-like Zn-dependent dehydrogenase